MLDWPVTRSKERVIGCVLLYARNVERPLAGKILYMVTLSWQHIRTRRFKQIFAGYYMPRFFFFFNIIKITRTLLIFYQRRNFFLHGSFARRNDVRFYSLKTCWRRSGAARRGFFCVAESCINLCHPFEAQIPKGTAACENNGPIVRPYSIKLSLVIGERETCFVVVCELKIFIRNRCCLSDQFRRRKQTCIGDNTTRMYSIACSPYLFPEEDLKRPD